MWPSADEISENLRSGAEERVREGLDALSLRLDLEEPVDLAPAGAEVLGPWADEDTQLELMKLWETYPGWRPAFDLGERAWQAALLAITLGNGAVALEASLLVKTADDPAAVAKDVLSRLVARGVTAGEVRGAAAWVSYLLAGKAPVRGAVVEALPAFTGALAAVRDAVDGELEDAELAAVRAALQV